ncbi:MAG: acyltransferase, partial [Actinomycetota bacterium]|nr:acyltransferase [Actinomycetota bacterium]
LMGRLLGNPVFTYVGTRSYGMYLYHWPIYQIIRGQAGVPMTRMQWLWAMALTLPITEASYRYIETPIRQGRLGEWMRGDRRPRTAAAYKRRQRVAGVGIASAALVGFAGVSIAMADNQCVGQIECSAAAAVDTTVPVSQQTEPTQSSVDPSASAVPGQTAPPPTETTTTVLQDKPYFAIGESVMLGAKKTMDDRGLTTVAEVSATPASALEQVKLAKTRYRITNGAVIQLGTNGTVTREEYDAVLNEFSDLNLIVVLTVKAPKPWIDENNALIRSLPETHPNVKVVDWHDRAVEIEGHLSNSDGGVHLSDKTAVDFYTNLILEGLGLPT